MGNKRTWGDPIGSGAGSGKHDSPMSKGRWYDPSNARINGEERSQRHHDRKADRKAAKKAEGSSLCAAFIIASSLSAAGLAAVVGRAKGWVA